MYTTYQQVAQLGEPALRQLLQRGDAVERVWAAWALAAAKGAQATPALLAELRESPTPGTRRHMIIILAGMGEREVLRAFAIADPDDDVRATACQYLIRIALPGDAATLAFVEDRAAADPSAIVRQSILAEQREFATLSFGLLAHLASDPSQDVRLLAARRLLESFPAAQLFPGVLEQRAVEEPDAELRRQLQSQCVQAGGAGRLLALSPQRGTAWALPLLRLLADMGQRIAWRWLAPAAALPDDDVAVGVMLVLDRADLPVALPWLLSTFIRADAEGAQRGAWICMAKTHDLLLSALPFLHNCAALDVDPSLIGAAIAILHGEIASLEQERAEAELAGWEQWDRDPEEYDEGIQERQIIASALAQCVEVIEG